MARSSLDEKLASSNHNLNIKTNGITNPDFNTDIEANHNPQHRTTLIPSPPSTPTASNELTPSLFLQKFIAYPSSGSLKLKPTSYLDGVRGVAALAVYIFHSMGIWAPLVPAYGADKQQTNILQLPILRTVFVSGGAAVGIFFVLSGYVLTVRSLGWMRSGEKNRVRGAVYSSMFRRGFRLYLPVIVTTFVEMLSTRFGYSPPLNFDFVPEETAWGQFMDWVGETNKLINPLHNLGGAVMGRVIHPKYEQVIWTIPVEFYGSFLVYFLVLFLVNFPGNKFRMVFNSFFALLCFGLGAWNLFCFVAGMILADLNLGQEEIGGVRKSGRKIWWMVFGLAFYVAGFPTLVYEDARANPMPGFETLRAMTPPIPLEDGARFWWSISGLLLLVSITQLPSLKRLFETDFCQYLGKISFSLYLVHEFCIVLFGLYLRDCFKKAVLGLDGEGVIFEGNRIAFWMTCGVWFVCFTGVVCGVASQVERWVDRGAVGVARGVEGWILRVLGRA